MEIKLSYPVDSLYRPHGYCIFKAKLTGLVRLEGNYTHGTLNGPFRLHNVIGETIDREGHCIMNVREGEIIEYYYGN